MNKLHYFNLIDNGYRVTSGKGTCRPALYYKVVGIHFGETLYQNTSIALCRHWQKTNNLQTKSLIKSVR